MPSMPLEITPWSPEFKIQTGIQAEICGDFIKKKPFTILKKDFAQICGYKP